MAVGLFIMSQGIIENKMKEFNFFYFSRGYRALNQARKIYKRCSIVYGRSMATEIPKFRFPKCTSD